MSTFDLKAELGGGAYNFEEREALGEHADVIADAMANRRDIELMGGNVSGYIRSAISDSPTAQLSPPLQAALEKLGRRYPSLISVNAEA